MNQETSSLSMFTTLPIASSSSELSLPVEEEICFIVASVEEDEEDFLSSSGAVIAVAKVEDVGDCSVGLSAVVECLVFIVVDFVVLTDAFVAIATLVVNFSVISGAVYIPCLL